MNAGAGSTTSGTTSSAHSRSEIESALGPGKQARKNQQENAFNPNIEIDTNRRRQQVIGGDLSGVAYRRNNSRIARLRDANYVNWIAGGIVILILVAFFWPQPETGTIKEVADRSRITPSESFYTESRIDKPLEQKAPSEQKFVRENDIKRADNFRDEDAMARRIRRLVTKAEEQIARGEYTQPPNNNAAHTYKQALLLSANEQKAIQGLEYIRNRFLETGLASLNNNDKLAAQNALNKISSVDANSDEHQQLQLAIEEWNTKSQVAELLSKAKTAFSKDSLILPARDNALYYFQQALVLEPDNKAGLTGVKSIADNFIEKANRSIENGQFQVATSHLATVSVIDPEHPSLSLMEERITKAKPIARDARASRSSQTAAPKSQTTRRPNNTSTAKRQPAAKQPTASKPPSEQETFDRKYLEQGLEAYYKGNYENAASLLQPLADKGVSRAQFRLGYMYFQGRGFKRDRVVADKIIRAALPAVQKFADEGRAWAQSDIGSLYEDGLVLPKDYGESVYWYRSAAEQGYPGAQTNLGIMYALGRGVSTSRRTAIEWFQRAAKQGDILAKRNLESMGISP